MAVWEKNVESSYTNINQDSKYFEFSYSQLLLFISFLKPHRIIMEHGKSVLNCCLLINNSSITYGTLTCKTRTRFQNQETCKRIQMLDSNAMQQKHNTPNGNDDSNGQAKLGIFLY